MRQLGQHGEAMALLCWLGFFRGERNVRDCRHLPPMTNARGGSLPLRRGRRVSASGCLHTR